MVTQVKNFEITSLPERTQNPSTDLYPQDRLEDKKYTTALTIAGSDPSGGAGIQADLKTFSALACYGMSVITALTAQNTLGVSAIQSLPQQFIGDQLKSIFDDIDVNAVKIGMLEREEIINEVAQQLTSYKPKAKYIVVDPVMFAKSGHALLKPEAIKCLKEKILPLATVLTPNIHEASCLLTDRKISTQQEMEAAAFELLDLGPTSVILKGGSLSPEHASLVGKDCFVIKGESQPQWLETNPVPTKNLHGTGCTFSAAITAYLAQGFTILKSVQMAKGFITDSIREGAKFQLGHGKGPVHHFYSTWPHGDFTQEIWMNAAPIYRQIINHPFLVELSQGTLPKEKFRYYLEQDHLFLLERSQAFSTLATRCEDPAMREYFNELATLSVEGAQNVFVKYGSFITKEDVGTKSATCHVYTDYMKNMVSQATVAEASVALIVCSLLYQKVGEHINGSAKDSNPYSDWIATYSNPERRERIKKFIGFVDRIASTCSISEYEKLKHIFQHSMNLEFRFWDAAYNFEQ